MWIGKLRHRVTIQRATETRNAQGGVIRAWAKIAERWAAIEPMAGSERLQAAKMKAESTHIVTIRHYDGLTTKDRLLYGTRTMEIGAIANLSERAVEDRLECKEVVV